jgi:glutaminyl-peptide cyclotransferase
MPRSMILQLLVLLAPLATACSAGAAPPRFVEPWDRPRFDGQAAFRHLVRQVEFGPRIPGHEGHRRQLEWMSQWLVDRADTLIVQHFTGVTTAGDTLEMANLFARFQPEREQRVLLLAHWDTRPRSDQAWTAEERAIPVPGANDGASGTAVLLQLAEMFRRNPPPVGVDLLLVDGEDYGPSTRDMFFGSRYFAANLPPDYRPMYGILLDMVGDRDLQFPIEGNSDRLAPHIVDRVWTVAESLGYGHVFLRRLGPFVEDDHIPMNAAGIPTINIIDFSYGPGNRLWHTPYDLPENTSPESLEIVGEVLTELLYRGG